MGNNQTTEASSRVRSDPLVEGQTEDLEVDESDEESENEFDLDCLFRPDSFSRAFSKLGIRCEKRDSMLDACRSELKDALDRRLDRQDSENVSFSLFCDVLSSHNLPAEQLLQLFEFLDHEGRGSFELLSTLRALRCDRNFLTRNNLNLILMRFEECSWTPGFADIFIDQRDDFKQLGLAILNYLLRNRLSSSALQCANVDAFGKILNFRDARVKSLLEDVEFPAGENELKSESSKAVESKKATLKKEGSISGDELMPEDDQQKHMNLSGVLALWQIQLLSATAKASLPMAPTLLDVALNQTRSTVNHLWPLSLAHDAEQRPSFLTPEFLREMASLIKLFPKQTDVLELILSFNLATGSVSDIFQCLKEIYASAERIDCSDLLIRLNKVRRQLLLNSCHVLNLSFRVSSSEGKDDKDDPRSVAETHWNQNAFSTKPGEQKADFLFESSEWVEFAKIKIKVENGDAAPKHGFIFVLPHWPIDSDLKAELDKFSSYDNWTKSEFVDLRNRKPMLKRLMDREPVAFFTIENESVVEVILDSPVIGKFVLVKFLEPRGADTDHLKIVGVKCLGLPRRPCVFLMERLVNEGLLSQDLSAAQSNLLTVQAVLNFLLATLAKQSKSKRNESGGCYNFRNQYFTQFDQKKGIAESAIEVNHYTSLLIAKRPFTKDSSFFEFEVLDHGPREHVGVTFGAMPENFLTSEPYYTYEGPELFCAVVNPDDDQPKRVRPGQKISYGVEYEGQKIKSIYYTVDGERIKSKNIRVQGNILYPAVLLSSGAKARLLNTKPWQKDDLASDSSETGNPRHLDFSGFTFNDLLDLLKVFPDRVCQSLLLQLMHSMVLWSPPDSIKVQNTVEVSNYLSSLIDKDAENVEDVLALAAKDLLTDGFQLFSPSKEAQLKMLFDLSSSSSELTGSKLVVLQSVCHNFCSMDLSPLMALPTKHLQDLDYSKFFSTMENLLAVSFHDSSELLKVISHASVSKSDAWTSHVQTRKSRSELLVHLQKLFNHLQTRFLCWVNLRLKNSPEAAESESLEELLLHYCSRLIIPRVEALLDQIKALKESDLRVTVTELEMSILTQTLPQLVLLLQEMCPLLSAKLRIKLLATLKISLFAIHKILLKVSELSFMKENKDRTSEKELRSWDVEMLADTNNMDDFSRKFACPGATSFEVDFIPDEERQEYMPGCYMTESQIPTDCLEFIDSSGNARWCAILRGRRAWPKNIRFDNTSYLDFTYYHDKEGQKYNHRFKVRAIKSVSDEFHWLNDIYLSLCRLFGQLSGSLLDKTTVFPKPTTPEGKVETEMCRSELWTTIFRGGLVVRRFERSLSGNYETEDHSDVADFLQQFVDLSTEKAKLFLNRCRTLHQRNQYVGGEEIDRTIRCVFVALIWHTQSLRHDISIYLRTELDGKISDGINEAFAAAENMRLFLVEKRQGMKKELEEQEERERNGEEKMPVVDVVHLVEEKARFLLQFAGLSRVASKSEESKRKYETRRSRQLSVSLSRQSTDSVVDLPIPIGSKYPSFCLVFDFVQDVAWSKEKVEELLKKRYNLCDHLFKAYLLASECIRTVFDGHFSKLPCAIFLRGLLSMQENFGQHYADGLDGCGLSMEANVRRSYYDLIRHLVAGLRTADDKSKDDAYAFVASCLLHLLDVKWQAYDLPFLVELRLPELYFSLTKAFFQAKSTDVANFAPDETQEEYERNLTMADEAAADVDAFRSNICSDDATKSRLGRFIVAKFQNRGYFIGYQCDSCGQTVKTDYYRCLECNDVDICKKCYRAGKVPSSGNHVADHRLAVFKFVCAGCKGFITGTRWRCDSCKDFELCDGCHRNSRFPTGSVHTATHAVSKLPSPLVTQNQSVIISRPMEVYVYHHAWMLFNALCFSSLDSLTRAAPRQKIDDTYLSAASQLLGMCVSEARNYLVSEFSSDVVDSAVRPATDGGGLNEETPSADKPSDDGRKPLITKVIGLLASLVSTGNPTPTVKSVTNCLLSEQFLYQLVDISRSEGEHNLQTRQMTLGLLCKLLQQMDISSEASESISSSENGDVLIVNKTSINLIQSLFNLGAEYLERNCLEMAKVASMVLHSLHRNPSWAKLLSHMFSEIVNLQKTEHTMSSVFALFAFTGFPQMLIVGTLVNFEKKGGEVALGVIEAKETDNESEVTDLASRQKITVPDLRLEPVTSDLSILTDSQLANFIAFVTDVVDSKIKKDSDFDAKTTWVLALVTKAILKSLNREGQTKSLALYDQSFLTNLRYLASLGTNLPKSLLLKHLEILSLEVCKASKEAPAGESAADSTNVEAERNLAVVQDSSAIDPRGGDLSMVFATADEYAEFMEAIQGAIPEEEIRQLRAIQDSQVRGRDQDAEGTGSSEDEAAQNPGSVDVDQGAMVVPNILSLANADIDVEDFTEDTVLEKQELIASGGSEDESKKTELKEKASKAMEKLRKDNAKDEKFLSKIVRALAILNARQLLMALISDWPGDQLPFAAKRLGFDNIADVFFIIHLFSGQETNKMFEQIAEKLISYCPPEDVVTIATASSILIGASLGQAVTIQKQLPVASSSGEDETAAQIGSSDGDFAFRDEVCIPGSTSLNVEFKQRSPDESDVEIVFSSSPDLTENVRSFSAKSPDEWTNFSIDGDRLYIGVKGSEISSFSSTWIMSGNLLLPQHFDVGFMALNSIFDKPDIVRSLPLGNFWKQLVSVANRSTRAKRLKTIRLLLKLLAMQTKSCGCESLSLDLSLLKELWNFYKTLLEQKDDELIKPAVVLALTELFFVAENVAQEWNVTEHFTSSIQKDAMPISAQESSSVTQA